MTAIETADFHTTIADGEVQKTTPKGKYLALLSFATLGVVYGDIGTSPLYAIRECFHGPHAIPATPANILGVLSLIFWSLILIISIKYLVFVLRANNDGEGGVLSLAALATPIKPSGIGEKWILIAIGVFGAALLYGDGVLTPAISVLGAMEGLSVATPALSHYIVPITIVILIGLFLLQSRGTAGVGKLFAPVTLIWFTTLAGLGIAQIIEYPQVLAAISPFYAFDFFIINGFAGFIILGSVFLVVTGGEALYADMGHFGPLPIRLTWFVIVLPALLLNYFGQGALLLENPETAVNPFYRLAPEWALYPMILLATSAAVIASQAVISGAFSLTMQAVQLGLSPRLKITHTSSKEFGQIYLPFVNWALMIGCIIVVLLFQTSSNLAAAYGIAVTSTMVITTVLFYKVARSLWKWRFLPTFALCAIFIVIDLAFFGANIIKFFDGGWFPLLLAAVIFTMMMTWKKGRSIMQNRIQQGTQPLDEFLEELDHNNIHRIPGTAVFMNGNASRTPMALIHNLEHNKVLHENVLFVTVKTKTIPFIEEEDRVLIEKMSKGLVRMKIYYGYMQNPNVPKVLKNLDNLGFDFKPDKVTYFLGHETIISSEKHSGMAYWREKLFSTLTKNARSATAFFKIPADRVVELGQHVEI